MARLSASALKVWDPLVRLVHWGMVASVSVAWLVTEGRIHDAAGYILLVLIALRVLWGFIGAERARFSSFVCTPHSVFQYAQQLCAGREPRHIGHNPLGGWMIVALLATGVAVSLSGWLYTTDAFWGIAWVERIHVFFSELLLVLAGLHIAGVIFTSIRQRENLIAAMIHGRKRVEDEDKTVSSAIGDSNVHAIKRE
ncbi:cytochrome b/b6 domain-containing protein [Bradyrhizobium sp. JYMT SZCCT0180]|nr:cytochrome b/b6 domain-containing protein [Bradyrhizobium sp. JYMT SZCCT0180]